MKEFFKTGRFRVLLVVGCLLFSFLLRSIYTGGLMPLLSSAGGMLMVPLTTKTALAPSSPPGRSTGKTRPSGRRYSGWRSS